MASSRSTKRTSVRAATKEPIQLVQHGLRFAIDENFNNDILRALRRHQPAVDIVRIQDTEVSGADDPAVLEWAAREGRVLLTQDVTTITRYAYERVMAGLPMPGVFEVSRNVPLRQVLDDILLLWECSLPGEWEGQVRYLPLR